MLVVLFMTVERTIVSVAAFMPHLPAQERLKESFQRPLPTRSSTVLHMNLFDRFTRVVNSNLNNVLKNLEDPEKIMNQALEDMQVGSLGNQSRSIRHVY
jgi:PspA/IM30 family